MQKIYTLKYYSLLWVNPYTLQMLSNISLLCLHLNVQQLEMELKKLQGLIQDGAQAFDDALYQLFLRKVKTEMVIYQVRDL